MGAFSTRDQADYNSSITPLYLTEVTYAKNMWSYSAKEGKMRTERLDKAVRYILKAKQRLESERRVDYMKVLLVELSNEMNKVNELPCRVL